jgi:hypothetical protein
MIIEIDLTQMEIASDYKLGIWLLQVRQMKSIVARKGDLEAIRAYELIESIILREAEKRALKRC